MTDSARICDYQLPGHYARSGGESPETSHPQSKMTIFSWVLATPVNEQETIEAPSHSISPFLKMRSYSVPPHP